MNKRLCVALLASVVAVGAEAQEGAAYYGLSFGSFDYSEDNGFGAAPVSDTTDSYRVLVGYQFSEHLAVEGGYGKTGTIRDSVSLPPSPGSPSQIDFSSEFSMLTLRVLGVLNLDSGITLLGGVGSSDMKQDIELTFPGFGSTSGDVSGWEFALYAGVQYDWDRVAVRLAHEKFNIDDVDVAETSVVFFYKL